MGLKRRISGGTMTSIPAGNPDPLNYEVLSFEVINGLAIVQIKYPDCKNYEGKKILVYEGLTQIDLMNKKQPLDPHFQEKKSRFVPIARFEPTDKGLTNARVFARTFGSRPRSEVFPNSNL